MKRALRLCLMVALAIMLLPATARAEVEKNTVKEPYFSGDSCYNVGIFEAMNLESANNTGVAALSTANTFYPVPMKKLANYKSLKKSMTDAEFQQAYNVALQIVTPLAHKSREEQLIGIAGAVRGYLCGMTYSMSNAHYNDPYGLFVLRTASCAGGTRGVGLCLNILGIPYEHVNENKWSHQWCRVNVGGTYWICDAFCYYCGPEPAPYSHPMFQPNVNYTTEQPTTTRTTTTQPTTSENSPYTKVANWIVTNENVIAADASNNIIKQTGIVEWNGYKVLIANGVFYKNPKPMLFQDKVDGKWKYFVNGVQVRGGDTFVYQYGKLWHVTNGELNLKDGFVKYNGQLVFAYKGSAATFYTGWITYSGYKCYLQKGVLKKYTR